MAIVYQTPAASTAELAFAFSRAGWTVSGQWDSAFVVQTELPPALDQYGYEARDLGGLSDNGPVTPLATVHWRPGRYRVDVYDVLFYNAVGAEGSGGVASPALSERAKSRFTGSVGLWMSRHDFSPSDVVWADYLNAYLLDAFDVEVPVKPDSW